MYDDELDDPKLARLSDFEYRVWHTILDFCNRSPARLRERGYCYHSVGFPVEICDLGRALRRPDDEVRQAVDTLCTIGGESSLTLFEDADGHSVLRVRAWRKRQDGDREHTVNPTVFPESSQNPPRLSAPDVDVDVDVDVRQRRKTRTEGGNAPQQPAPPPAYGSPTPRSTNPTLCWYYDAYHETLGKECVHSHAQHGKQSKTAEAQFGTEPVRAAFHRYLTNPFYRDRKGCPVSLFFSETVLSEMLNGSAEPYRRGSSSEAPDGPPLGVDVV